MTSMAGCVGGLGMGFVSHSFRRVRLHCICDPSRRHCSGTTCNHGRAGDVTRHLGDSNADPYLLSRCGSGTQESEPPATQAEVDQKTMAREAPHPKFAQTEGRHHRRTSKKADWRRPRMALD